MVDLIRHLAFCFKLTKNADKYIKDNSLSIPNTIQDTFNGCSDNQAQFQIPSLDVISYVYSYIRDAKQLILDRCKVSNMIQSILMDPEDEIRQISQVVLVHSKDEGEFVPVGNRFRLKEDSSKIDDVCQLIQIPSESDVKEFDSVFHPLLGCYMRETGVILLWIDRIFDSTDISGHLLFQEVLLHELIHALLDCADRDNNLNVLLNDTRKLRHSEETLDNLLVLLCYENCDKISFEAIKSFINSQPSEYKRSIALYDWCKKMKWEKNMYSAIISGLLYFKVLPNQGLNSSPFLLYRIVEQGKEDEDLSAKELVEDGFYRIEANIALSDEYMFVKDINGNNSFFCWVFDLSLDNYNFITTSGDKVTLTKIIITLTISNILQIESNCSFHFIQADGSIGDIMYYKFFREGRIVDEIIKSSLIICKEKYYRDFIHEIIKNLNPETRISSYKLFQDNRI